MRGGSRFKIVYYFYYIDKDGKRVDTKNGLYKVPSMSAEWKRLQKLVQRNPDIKSVGYDLGKDSKSKKLY